MFAENTTRTSFLERFQAIIDRYNSGGALTEDYFSDLMDFAENLREEEERGIKFGLTESELELFDLIQKNKLTKKRRTRC